MSINTEFYTNPHSWTPSVSFPDIKIADWTYTGAMEGSIGALTMQKGELGIELDPSIIPWKINEKSDVMRRQYAYGQQDYSHNPWSSYTQLHKGIKRGYRFILGGQGDWSLSSPPPNVPGQLPVWNSRHNNWTDLATYSTTGFSFEKYLIPFLDFNYHDTIAYYTIAYVGKSWYPGYPDEAPYTPNEIAASNLTDSWLANNWVVGFKVYIYSGGKQSPEMTGYKCQFIPFDPVHPSLYAATEFSPYGKDTLQYWNGFLAYDDNRYGVSIGGYYGQWNILNHPDPIAEDWYNYGTLGGYGADKIPETLGGVINNVESDEQSGEYALAHAAFKGGSSWNYLSAVIKDYNSMTADEIKAYMRTQLAYLGFIFTEWKSLAIYGFRSEFTSYYYVPEIDSDGVTTGNYKPYPESDYDNTDWTTGIPDVTPYDPEADIPDEDPNEYDDNTTVLNGLHLNPEFSTRYCLTRSQLAHAHTFLMSEIATNVDSDFWAAQTLYTNDPMDVVQSVMLFPFDISDYQTDEPSYMDLSFGQLIDTGYQVQLNRESYCIINMGGCTYYPKMGNNVKDFRNYPPYSSALLYIPYCGSVEIDPNLYMGQSLSVKMIVDMGTGSCLALVYRNGMVVDSVAGNIGITIPLTGIQTQTLAAAQRQAETQLQTAKRSSINQLASGAAKVAAGALLGGPMGVVGAAIYQQKYGDLGKAVTAIQNAQFNLEHINVPYKTIGTASSTTSYANERKCRLIIRRPVMLTEDLTDYAHSVGYACLTPGVVGDFSGYTEFESVDLSGISATAAEKDMLMKLLQSGVYI